jgi:hypothetical protein
VILGVSHGCDGLPSLLSCHVGQIDVVDVWARSPLVDSGVLQSLDGEKADTPSMPCSILGVGSERPLRFSLWHK